MFKFDARDKGTPDWALALRARPVLDPDEFSPDLSNDDEEPAWTVWEETMSQVRSD